jgi:streptomycin 6-kinase
MNKQPVFISNIIAVYGEEGKQWLQELPAHIEYLSQRWNLRFLHAVADLSFSFVAFVKSALNHEILILKTAPRGGMLSYEVRWLRSFKKSVPQVLNWDGERNAFLMENLQPGITLKSLVKNGQDDAATRIICETILALQAEQVPLAAFKHLSELSQALPILNGHLKNFLISKAQSLFRDLCADSEKDVLLHGDLHHDNILQSGAGWKAIDPHGYVGDAAAEAGVMIRNPFDCFPADASVKKILSRRLDILTESLPFDALKIRAWAFCLTALSAAWDIEGHGQISQKTQEVVLVLNQMQR